MAFTERVSMVVNDRIEYLIGKALKLPMTPGVYRMMNKSGTIIYIGKAKALKNRVTSYFRNLSSHTFKTRKLVEKIYDFDFLVAPTEMDALILEATLIKQYSPKYNILLKDDKGFNYIKISGGPYPKITYALNNSDKNAEYIGPYTSGYTVKQSIEEANRLFSLPSCTHVFPRDFNKYRPCLNFHIGRCMGVCRGTVSEAEYKGYVADAVEYIKGGSKQSVERLKKEMEQAAEDLQFEKAAKLRDTIAAISKIDSVTKMCTTKTIDYDIIALSSNIGQTSVAVVKYRGGRIHDKENFFVGEEGENGQVLSEFVLGYYSEKTDIPKEIYVDGDIDDKELLEEYLKNLSGHKVTFIHPKRGEMLTQLTLARANAGEYLAFKVGRTAKEISALEQLSGMLGLEKIPEIIESYDISNMGEDARVGGMVVYKNGRPHKPSYKKFTIKEVVGIDDYACMQEVLRRRLKRYLDGDEDFAPLPDLILLDGGKGHVQAVSEVLAELKLDIPLFGMVKDDKHRTRAIARQGGEIQINANKNVFSFVTGIQDEVHRFSINFQRQTHKKKQYELELTRVKGIGEAKAFKLLKHYRTKQAMKEASAEELAKIAGVNISVAEELYLYIQEIF